MDKFLVARQQTYAEVTFDVRKPTQADASHRLRLRCIRFYDLIFDFNTQILRASYRSKRSVFMQITLCVSRWFDAGNDFGHRSTVLLQLTSTNRSINFPYIFCFQFVRLLGSLTFACNLLWRRLCGRFAASNKFARVEFCAAGASALKVKFSFQNEINFDIDIRWRPFRCGNSWLFDWLCSASLFDKYNSECLWPLAETHRNFYVTRR